MTQIPSNERDEGPSQADIERAERVAEREAVSGSGKGGGWALKAIAVFGGLMVAAFIIYEVVALVPRGSSRVPELTEAVFIGVVDGRTFRVRIGERDETVRLIGVATPPIGNQYAGAVMDANRQLLNGKTLMLEKDADDRDSEGRLLRYVYVDGNQVNALLLANGWAWNEDSGHNARFVAEFRQIEATARAEKRGLWAVYATPPAGALRSYPGTEGASGPI